MKRWKRRTIFVIAIVIFCLVSPLAILYTSGYRYDHASRSLEKIGMIIIKSMPEDVNVYLNDQFKADKTPYKENNLFPGMYNVKITKEGYHTWEKNLTVGSKMVTWISNARIFLLDPPIQTITHKSKISDFTLAPDYKNIAYTTTSEEGVELWLANINDLDQAEKVFPIEQSSSEYNNTHITNLKWSANSNKLLFNLDDNLNTKHLVIDTAKPAEPKTLAQTNLEQLSWDSQDADFVYYLRQNNLESVNITKPAESTIIAQNVVSYNLESHNVYYLKRRAEKNGLVIYRFARNKTEPADQPEEIYQLPDNGYHLKISPHNKIALLGSDKSLFLIDEGEFKKLGDKVIGFDWTEKDDGLVFHTPNEVWFYKVSVDKNLVTHPQYSLNKANLLTRYSTEIDAAIWYPDEEHILFATHNKLYIKELDSRDKANSVELATDFLANDQAKILTDKKGKKIYYQSSAGELANIIEKEIY